MLPMEKSCAITMTTYEVEPEKSFDFNALIPKASELSEAELKAIAQFEDEQNAGQGTDAMPIELFNRLLTYFLDRKDYRSALWITLQANTGLRYIDVAEYKRIDLINEFNNFRESILETERKTGKKRVNFINDAIKMATLLYVWQNPNIKPMDYLLAAGANAKRKGYEIETYIDADGKERCLKNGAHYVYKLDAFGNKIPKPLSRGQSCKIMRDAFINGLGISLKNDNRTKGNEDAYLNLASHSLRKAYAAAVTEQYVQMFDKDLAYAHAAAMEQLQFDLNHSSRAMTYHYTSDYIATKKKINMKMNLGADVLRPYFETELTKRQH